MSPTPYNNPSTPYTITTFSPSSAFSCSTYRADLSHKYGICESLHPNRSTQTLDLQTVRIGGMAVGDVISMLFLVFCAAVLLMVVKWALDYRFRSRWALVGDDERWGKRGRSLERRVCDGLRISLDGAERGWKEVGAVMQCREDEWKWR